MGEQCKSIFFIVQGRVQLTTEDKNGVDKHVCYLQQGDSIGQYSILFDEPSNFTAKAVTKVRLLSLS